MSDIRFNQWLHNSGTGGVSQVDGGHVGIGTTNPLIPVGAGNTSILNVGVVTANSFYGSGANLTGITGTTINSNADNRLITGSGTANTLNGESNLTFDGSTFAITGGVTATTLSTFSASGSALRLNDGSILRLGNADADFFLYHDGSSTDYISAGAGKQLRLTTDDFVIKGANNTETLMTAAKDGAVELYHDNSKTLYTNSTGATVKGGNTSAESELKVFGNEGQRAILMLAADDGDDNADYWQFQARTDGNLNIQNYNGGSWVNSLILRGGGAAELYHNNSKKFETTSSGATLTGDLYTTSRLLVNTTSAGESNGDEATFANPGGNAGITIRSAVNNECKIYFSEGTSGGSQYRGAINYNQNTNYMAFSTNENERWRITSDGTMYPQGNYTLGLNSNTAFRMNEVNSNKFVHRYGNSGSAGTNQQEAIWYGGGITVMHDNQTLSTSSYTWGLTGNRGYAIFRLKNSGGQAIYAESGSITSGSDYRMKENIVEITNGIETVKKLKPSIYNIRKTFNPNDDGKKHHGFVAHEVQEAIPDIGNIVSGTKDAVQTTEVDNGKPDYQGIDYGHMTPVLAAAIKELITKVETLEAEVASLKSS